MENQLPIRHCILKIALDVYTTLHCIAHPYQERYGERYIEREERNISDCTIYGDTANTQISGGTVLSFFVESI